jgi:hypothetical protein
MVMAPALFSQWAPGHDAGSGPTALARLARLAELGGKMVYWMYHETNIKCTWIYTDIQINNEAFEGWSANGRILN